MIFQNLSLPQKMHVIVKNSNDVILEVDPHDTIERVKVKINNDPGIKIFNSHIWASSLIFLDVREQRLVFTGRQLDDVNHFCQNKESIINLVSAFMRFLPKGTTRSNQDPLLGSY